MRCPPAILPTSLAALAGSWNPGRLPGATAAILGAVAGCQGLLETPPVDVTEWRKQ